MAFLVSGRVRAGQNPSRRRTADDGAGSGRSAGERVMTKETDETADRRQRARWALLAAGRDYVEASRARHSSPLSSERTGTTSEPIDGRAMSSGQTDPAGQ